MANVKQGDMVILEYTGRLASGGQVFDTTDESVAKKAGIYSQDEIYGPRHALFGTRTILPGVEEAIVSSQLGKAEEFTIPAEKAFGKRLPQLVRMLPEKDFHGQEIRPAPGLVVSLDGMLARVKSVTSGRVVVDLNHPLAGESVVYSLKVVEIISDDQKKIEKILLTLGLKGKVTKNEKNEKEKGKDWSPFSISFEAGSPEDKIERAKSAIAAIMPGAGFKERQQ